VRPSVVHLVRHGRTPSTGKVLPGRAPGLHLAKAGEEQAQRAAERLASLDPRPVAVYASPLERTRETAAPIARALSLRVRTDPGLLECDFGTWTGASLARLSKRPAWRTVQGAPSTFRFPDGESFGEMQVRAFDAVVALTQAHPGASIVAVSHADPIKAIVAMAAGVPLDLFQRLVISPCSITTLAFTGHGAIVLSVNSTATLSELVPS
jgi:probable phosphoglycerate mutase